MHKIFLVETSVLSSTIKEKADSPISLIKSFDMIGPKTFFISILHLVRCIFNLLKLIDFTSNFGKISTKWSVVLIDECSAMNAASLSSIIFVLSDTIGVKTLLILLHVFAALSFSTLFLCLLVVLWSSNPDLCAFKFVLQYLHLAIFSSVGSGAIQSELNKISLVPSSPHKKKKYQLFNKIAKCS